MIIKSGNKYKILSKDGKKVLGEFSTKAEAEKRLKEIEFFKHLKGKKK